MGGEERESFTCQDLDRSCTWSVLLFTFLFNIQWSQEQDEGKQPVTCGCRERHFRLVFRPQLSSIHITTLKSLASGKKNSSRSAKHCSKQTQYLSEHVPLSANTGECEWWLTPIRDKEQQPGCTSYFPEYLAGQLKTERICFDSRFQRVSVHRSGLTWQSHGSRDTQEGS